MAKQQEPRKVTSVPEGYNKEIRDGKIVYVKKTQSETKPASIPTNVKPKPKAPSSNKPKLSVPPRPRPKSTPPKDTFTEDVVYLEEPITPPIQKPQSLRTDMQQIFPSGLQKGYNSYMVPDLTTGGNYAKQKNVITDSEGFPVTYDFKTNQYIKTGEPIIRDTMPVQNDTPTIQAPLKENELPTTFDSKPERLRTTQYNTPKVTVPVVDESKYKGFNDLSVPSDVVTDDAFKAAQAKKLAMPELKKGGIVSKVKGYDTGGVIGQNDPYAIQNAQIAQQQKEEGDKKARQDKARNVANTVGKGLGGVGSAYYNSQTTNNQSDATRNAGLAAVSQIGGIGGAIGGLAALGDKFGKPVKEKSEQIDENGNLVNSNKAQQNAIGGGLLSPSKALATRSTYAGGYSDITGKGYLKSIEDKAKAQIQEIKDANTVSKQQQAINARNAGELDPTLTNPYDLNNSTFDANKQLVLADGSSYDSNRPRYKKGGIVSKIQMCADGGQIKGKGTGKSDSILAKVEADSFVVPEENAPVAEKIRATFLGKPPKSKANLNQKGGETVKLSNGEHLYTPEEKEELLSKGVSVNLLAPKSEVKAVKKDHMQFPNVIIGLKDGGTVPKGTKVDGVTWNGTNWVDSNGNKYTSEKGKVFEEKYKQLVAKTKSDEETKKASELSVYKRKYNEAKEAGNDTEAAKLDAKIKSLSGKTKVTPSEVKSESGSSVVVPKSSNIKVPKSTSKYTAPSVEYNPSDDALVPNGTLSPNQLAANKTNEEKAIADAKLLNDSAIATGITSDNMGKNNNYPKKGGILDKIGNIDPTAFVGIGQTALGLNMLGKSKRPIDIAKIDPTYNAAVDKSIQDAKFGLTPEQRFVAEQDIQNSLNDSKFQGVNYSGGNGVQAFNLNRSAINDAWKNKLGLKIADTDLRMSKQKYADAMSADRANILASNRRQAFNDAMGTFQQTQAAGSELIGAGLQNTIGAYRFKKDQEARAKADAERNAWTRQI